MEFDFIATVVGIEGGANCVVHTDQMLPWKDFGLRNENRHMAESRLINYYNIITVNNVVADSP